jgi:hypothetical protein
MWTPPVSPLPWFLFPFLALSRAHAVGAGGPPRRRQPWAPPPAALAPRDGGRVPLCRICTARLRPQTLAATLQEAAPTSPPCTAPPLGDFPPNPSTTAPRIREGGVEEEGGSGGDQDHRPGAEPLAAGGVKRIPHGTPRNRGCCTRKISLRKPWTAPLCFPCSRPFHAARHHLLAVVSRSAR